MLIKAAIEKPNLSKQTGSWSVDLQDALRTLIVLPKNEKDLLPKLTDTAARFFTRYGYSSFLYGTTVKSHQGSVPELHAITTMPSDWVEHYGKNDLYKHDAILHHLVTSSEPIHWSTLRKMAQTGDLPEDQLQFLNRAGEFGVKDGVSFRLRQNSLMTSGYTFVSEIGISIEEQKKLFSENQYTLAQLGQFFETALEPSIKSMVDPGLTARELDVLKWASEGLLTKQIADKLRTSPHTVAKQVKSAQNRLGAKTLVHAVSKAIMLGLID